MAPVIIFAGVCASIAFYWRLPWGENKGFFSPPLQHGASDEPRSRSSESHPCNLWVRGSNLNGGFRLEKLLSFSRYSLATL